MENTDAPSPVQIFQTLTAYQHTAALKAAIELDLFTGIAENGATAADLAKRCNAAERGIRILCDYLTVLGFLQKNAAPVTPLATAKRGEAGSATPKPGEGGSAVETSSCLARYYLTKDSAAFLTRNSATYAGGAAEFLLSDHLTQGFANVAAAVRNGGTVQGAGGSMAPEHPMWRSFARGMSWLMLPGAQALAEIVALDPARETKVLDISASHGMWGLSFAQQNARAHVVAIDWAPVLQIARENATRMQLAERFSTIEGSAFEVDFGCKYDLILLPNFLHHFDSPTCVQLLRKCHSALREKGRIAIVEFVPNADRVSPPEAATFSLVMLVSTEHGDAYTFAEFEQMLDRAGFTSIEQHPLPPGVSTAIIATKA